FGITDRSGTRWKFAWIPFGGYVKMFGDVNPASVPDSEKMEKLSPEEEKFAFHSKPLGAKAAVVAAGPIANFLLSAVILVFFFMYYGKPVTSPEVTDVAPASAAQEAGLLAGDVITAIDNSR